MPLVISKVDRIVWQDVGKDSSMPEHEAEANQSHPMYLGIKFFKATELLMTLT